jgi:hypothetical protein
MRCYNAAMSERFQFSMRRLFIATTLFGAAAALGRFVEIELNEGIQSVGGVCLFYVTFFGGLGAFIAGCGVIIERHLRRLIRPLAILMIFGLLLCLLSVTGFRH